METHFLRRPQKSKNYPKTGIPKKSLQTNKPIPTFIHQISHIDPYSLTLHGQLHQMLHEHLQGHIIGQHRCTCRIERVLRHYTSHSAAPSPTRRIHLGHQEPRLALSLIAENESRHGESVYGQSSPKRPPSMMFCASSCGISSSCLKFACSGWFW